jgi:hypothetical protein
MMNVRGANPSGQYPGPDTNPVNDGPGIAAPAGAPTRRQISSVPLPVETPLRPFAAARFALSALSESIPEDAVNVRKKTWSAFPIGSPLARAAVTYQSPPTPEHPYGEMHQRKALLLVASSPLPFGLSVARLYTRARSYPLEKQIPPQDEPKKSRYQRIKARFTGE